MTRTILSLLIMTAILVSQAAPSQAQQMDGRMYLGAHGGFSFPVGKLNDYAEGSWSAAGSFEYMTSDKLAWGVVASYNDFRTKDATIEKALGDTNLESTYNIIELSVQARWFLYFDTIATRSHPYVRVGAGMYFKQGTVKGGTSDPPLDEEESNSTAGWHFGVGYQMAIGEKSGLDFAITHHSLFDKESINGIDIEHSQYWLFSVGFLFGMGPDAPATAQN